MPCPTVELTRATELLCVCGRLPNRAGGGGTITNVEPAKRDPACVGGELERRACAGLVLVDHLPGICSTGERAGEEVEYDPSNLKLRQTHLSHRKNSASQL